MKYEIPMTQQGQTAIGQIKRAMACLVRFESILEKPLDYVQAGRAIVVFSVTRSMETLIVELVDPNPEYAECGDPLQTIFSIDLTGEIFVDEEIIEAISDHLIDHQIRFQYPCETHPSERCSDCHLRLQPCTGREGV